MHSPPPKKKRRLAMPEFESSFNVGADRDQPSRNSKSFRKTSQLFDKLHGLRAFEDNDTAEEERGFGGAKRVKTPAKTSRTATKSHFVFPPFEVSSPSGDRNKTGTHLPSMSAAFSDFSSNFGLERKDRPHPAITPTRNHYGNSTTIPVQSESRIQKPKNIPRTPLRVFEPPQLSDMKQRTLSSPWNRTKNLVITPTTPKIDVHDTRKLTSVASHLSSLKPNTASEAIRDTPKKPIGSFSPNVLFGKPTPAFTPSKISHIERAERIAQSVHDDYKAKTAEMPISDFIRGMDISPQKGHHGERRKFIRGGLAERVQHLILKSSTNLTLWQTERDKDVGCSKPPVKGDLHLRIISILSYTYHPTGIYRRQPSTVNPRTALATCYILDDNCEDRTKLVVFLIPSNKPNGDIHTGKEVYVWRPWHEIQIPRVDEGLEEPKSQNSEYLVTDTALLCSRFIVLP